jgi:hypothetical protein
VPSDTVAQLLAHAGLDRKGNEVTPRPWKKKKAPPPPAAKKAAEAKADEAKAEAPSGAAPEAKGGEGETKAEGGGEAG